MILKPQDLLENAHASYQTGNTRESYGISKRPLKNLLLLV